MPEVKTMRERGVEAGEALLGTCDSIQKHASDEETDNVGFCAGLDSICMTCNTCGWWCDSDEMDDDQTCAECQE